MAVKRSMQPTNPSNYGYGNGNASVSIASSIDRFDKLPPVNEESGSSFGWMDRLMFGWRDGMVFDYSDWKARDLEEMLKKDYKATQIEQVISLPIIRNSWDIMPGPEDKGEAKWMQGSLEDPEAETSLQDVISQCTSAFTYQRAYFEKVWGQSSDGDGLFYKKISNRPATTCRMARDPKNGMFTGIEQEPFLVGPGIVQGVFPIFIPAKRAFVYTHGTRLDPMNGVSALAVTYWAWKTKSKLMYLWFQFLEGVSLPRVIVKAQDITTAISVANKVARMKSSGVLPVATPGSTNVEITALDVSGKGAEQFTQAISFLDTASADSVLAGFLNLTGRANMAHFGGSYALSKDASDFFLQQLQAKSTELEEQIRQGLFRPLVKYNKGKQSSVPILKFHPLNAEDQTNAIGMLQAALVSPANVAGIPPEFISSLAEMVSNYFGLDGDAMKTAFVAAAKKAADTAAAQGVNQQGQQVAAVAGAVGAATDVTKAAAGQAPPPQNSQLNNLDPKVKAAIFPNGIPQ